ncbi:MAG: SDR family NAD(P)-dependent oxidoreductase [Anaerolineales bacterium]
MAAVLVTGAAGFIGSHVCERLVERGDRIVGLDNFDPYYDPALKRANVAALAGAENFTLLELDIRDAQGVSAAMAAAGVERVMHLAALAGVRASVARAGDYIDVNVHGTANVLEAVHTAAVKDVVLVSTSSVYGVDTPAPFAESAVADRPLAPYPASKRAAEMLGHTYHHLYGINVSVMRLFNVYGPRCRPDTMPSMLADSVLHGTEVPLFDNGQLRRDWTYIDDIVDGLLAALDHPRGYEIYNLGRGAPVLLSEFIEILQQIAGREANVRPVAAPATEPKITFADIDKARVAFGYDPTTPVVDGLNRFWEWRMNQPDVARGRA